MDHDMPGPRRPRTVLGRVMPHLVRALAYWGACASIWMPPEVVDFLMGSDQERDGDGHADPDRVTPYGDLPEPERRLFLELDTFFPTKDAP